jgi:cell division initiation protein
MVTVKDIREKEFAKQKHGYNEQEVDVFLDEIGDQMEALIQENKALIQQAQDARAALERTQNERPAPAPFSPVVESAPAPVHANDEAYFRNLESTLRETLLSAQRIADDTVSDAKKKAAAMVSEAEEKASAMVSAQMAEVESAKVELESIRKAADDYRIRFKRLIREQLHALKVDEGEFLEASSGAEGEQ